jgi:AcrR family transcriptional regulator
MTNETCTYCGKQGHWRPDCPDLRPTRRYRQTPADRKAAILEAAVNLAQLDGYRNLTSKSVARVAGVSQPLVMHYFWTTEKLLTAVMEEAVRRRVLSVVAEGLAHRHPAAVSAPVALRQAAAATLVGEV